MKKIWGAILAVLGLISIYFAGRRWGFKKAKLEGLEREEDLLNDVAEKELEVKRSKPIVERVDDVRERIRTRRGGTG